MTPSDETPQTPLHKILDGDQHEARVQEWAGASRMIARSVGAHYRELVDGGVPEKRAYRLAEDFQRNLMFEKVNSRFVGSPDFGDD